MNPKITILMAVYNGEKFLREAVESILHQTFTDFELLIINDASTDKSMEILSSYEDPRIRIINNEKNLGLTKSLNKGLSFAKSNYIARMDADDISYPERLEIQYHYMEDNIDVDIVGSWIETIDENGNTINVGKNPHSSEEIYYILNFRNCLTHSSIMFRKDIIVGNGSYNETLYNAQDYELWHRISKVSRIYQIQRVLVKWRMHDNLTDSNKKRRQEYTVGFVVKNNFEHLINKKIDSNICDIIKANFEASYSSDFKPYNSEELFSSVTIFSEVNKRIIEVAPQTLNKQTVKKIGDKVLRNYVIKASINIEPQRLKYCISKCINYNIILKMMIAAHIAYKKLKYNYYLLDEDINAKN
jgi:glycosyltransferase involved in cell wall biosynthesis